MSLNVFLVLALLGLAPLRWLLVALSGDYSFIAVQGLLIEWIPLLQSMDARCTGLSRCSNAGSVVVSMWLMCSMACGLSWTRGSNHIPLHCQLDSYSLYHEGSSRCCF